MITLTLQHREYLRRWAGSAALLPFAIYFATADAIYNPGALWQLFHAACLIPHEAGHFFFRVFGEFAMIAGGTIMQILLPAILVFQGVYWEHRLGTQLALLWLGQSCVDVSIYAADASAQSLPLLGGSAVIHDWHYMLARLDWLAYHQTIAGAWFAAGCVVWLVMLAVPAVLRH
ncbi:hypothetical protein BH23BAC4_BH23BAC4_12870 [soil metagenome]